MEDQLRDYTAEQTELLASLISRAAWRAQDVLGLSTGAVIAKRIDDDGFSMIERLELSPLADDQLLALALRRAGRAGRGGLRKDLTDVFASFVSSLEIEALRCAVMASSDDGGVPTAAATAVGALCHEGGLFDDQNRSALFRCHANLYTDLWCDPRIGAPLAARKIMLAMVTCLHELSQKVALIEPK
jgi:hypothetical protein